MRRHPRKGEGSSPRSPRASKETLDVVGEGGLEKGRAGELWLEVSREGRMRRRWVLSTSQIEAAQLWTLTEKGSGGGVTEATVL